MYKLHIASDDDTHLKAALELFELPRIVSYQVIRNTLFLYCDHKKNTEKIPFPSKKTEYLQQFIKSWLVSIEYPREPDHDGSNGKGYEIFVYSKGGYCDFLNTMEENEATILDPDSIVFDGWHISIVVKPHWVEYAK
jgi:hypothetical protein